MSYRAFVVCEDHTLDQYVVVPIIKSLLSHLGKGQAVVKVVTNPRLTGISHVEDQFEEIAERYAAIGDLVIFALDRDALDGLDGRKSREAKFQNKKNSLSANVHSKVHVVLAVEETEVWALWGSRSEIAASWQEVRAERDSKERFFQPLLTPGDAQQPGAGRGRLTSLSLASGWRSIAAGCPELKNLQNSLAAGM